MFLGRSYLKLTFQPVNTNLPHLHVPLKRVNVEVEKIGYRNFWPKILGENTLATSVQKFASSQNSLMRNDQNFWPIVLSKNVVPNYIFDFSIIIQGKHIILQMHEISIPCIPSSNAFHRN